MLALPAHLRDRMIATHGEAARLWLEELPHNLDALRRTWKFALGQPFANLSYAYVAEATLAGGAKAVLKAQPPHLESRSGIRALAAWNGHGVVKLLRHDTEGGFELLERAIPGVTLEDCRLDDDEATHILAANMAPLWVEPRDDPALISPGPWARQLFEYPGQYGENGPLPLPLVEEAGSLYRQLLASSPKPVLLHGDLHHGNILSATRAPWLVIDPKGVAGDPAFEPGAMFFNSHPMLAAEQDIPTLIQRRHAIVCDVTGLDPYRVAAWGFARAMLSLCWSASSGSPVSGPTLDVARALRALT